MRMVGNAEHGVNLRSFGFGEHRNKFGISGGGGSLDFTDDGNDTEEKSPQSNRDRTMRERENDPQRMEERQRLLTSILQDDEIFRLRDFVKSLLGMQPSGLGGSGGGGTGTTPDPSTAAFYAVALVSKTSAAIDAVARGSRFSNDSANSGG